MGWRWDGKQRLQERKRDDSPTEAVTPYREECRIHVAKEGAQEGTPIHSSALRVCLGFLIQDYFCFSFSDCSIWNV